MFYSMLTKSKMNRNLGLPHKMQGIPSIISLALCYPFTNYTSQPRAIGPPGFTPVGGATQGALVPSGGADTSSSTPSSQLQANGSTNPSNTDTPLTVGPHTGSNGLPLAANSVLPARPHLPDDPVIPHNGFTTVEEGEKAFVHLLKKAGVDANWTWDQTMRAIITDPLYKALNTLAEKKACWEKVCIISFSFFLCIAYF